jgi:hypothetical protein
LQIILWLGQVEIELDVNLEGYYAIWHSVFDNQHIS